MTAQMKQRIVGIVVLVFLALIVLPWLFGNKHPAIFEEKSSKEKLLAANVPDIIQESPSAPTPVADKVEYNNQKVDSQRVHENSASKAFSADSIKPPEAKEVGKINSDKISNIENAIVHTQDLQVHEEKKKNKSTITDVSISSPHLEKIKLALNKTEKNSNKQTWAVQLGSFSNKTNVEKLVKQLKTKGYPVYTKKTSNPKGNNITRVYVGAESHHSAEATANKIEKMFHIKGVLVKANI